MKNPLAALLLALTLCSHALAESKVIGDYTVHFIAVNSTFLNPKIAEQYDIKRSKRGAFVNVAVLRNNADGKTTPVTATLSGEKKNLMGQSAPIPFVEIREGDSIYYIGQFAFSNAETLHLSVQVQPEGKGQAYPVTWTTQLYSD